ncbi:formate dehydrogenase subunit gamma [Endozoicomonas sp. SM1973]|uniref:NADH-quinone oxidoreductase subunit E n=1 Tax=Spartinivicinus marinus TaxID=2994442 RepID=A0A853I8F1_9GAMM|nr:formate dehydrogenase subunit gamma [Spartinivicinus marinus]MCX4028164.1 formate dehydrogenase subunit gamma [Spartinivicinus marinus]NYZ66161.1 formate dehydrogenase subunit gamma [Spartinivicinus marinus]
MQGNSSWDRQLVEKSIDSLKDKPGALLPILHSIQDQLGYIPSDAVPLIADKLNLSRADVHGVISFYHHFRSKPCGEFVIQVCRAEACQAMGSRQLEQTIKQTLGIDYHQTTLDGSFTLEPVYCLGNCACSPSIRVNDDIHGRMTTSKFSQLVDKMQTVAVEVQ